jgi:hypothetical protein
MTKTKTSYTLYWREKSNPRHAGEGMVINNIDAAERIIRKANEMFPKFEHFYIQNKQQDGQEHSDN